MNKLISIDMRADLGFLKKPDINEKDSIYLTYNMLHKPALLGILGAIIGLAGYHVRNKMPEYYERLKNLRVGIQPLGARKGNFLKSVVVYKNGVGYASQEEGGSLIIREQILIKPAFRCYLLLDLENLIHQNLFSALQKREAEYLPYFGKNEFSLWWDDFQEYTFQPFEFCKDYEVETIFTKSKQVVREMVQHKLLSPFATLEGEPKFMHFEELPVGFDEQLYQYEKCQFVYSNFTLSKELKLEGLYRLERTDGLIQLF